ncbi:type VII secretion-associated serine protease mycosin [Streptomyces sp. HNM0575]|uniref:type VII secretion-associated serine protease mycosin n=1 Tax=Streptomyces sp. HNM0575 TaxID=2716338 RepID=UPI00145FA8B3|nr:type VII secretion-associated serine protease mycosin [Streptomyces sp. HNM0575]NLU76535.1 type VII secretion-associated serine protease mycosin [Streptomyces sp. HNM0575]
MPASGSDVSGSDENALSTGAVGRRSRKTRCAQRAFVVLAALGLTAVGTAVPATADEAHHRQPGGSSAGREHARTGQDPGLDSTGECKFGGKDIKSTPWSLQRVLLDELWSEATGKGVTVAVIDTGVDKDNPQIRPALGSGGKDFVGKSKNGTTDVEGHGTRVAGIIAARKSKDKESGFTGIAPAAEILPLRYTGSEDPEEKGNARTLAKAIDYAVSKKVKIINISSDTADKKSSPDLQAAIQKAVDAGILVVAAAGNDGANGKQEYTYPASYEGVLAVAASDRNNERAYFSQSGRFVDIAAPGVGMVSTVPDGGQCPADGTSFSAPYVAGVAALMYEKYPNWDAQQIAGRMQQTADRPGSRNDTQLGWGVVDPVAALTGDDDPPQDEPHSDTRQQSRHVTPMNLTVGESATERTQRISVYVMAAGTVLTLLIGGTAIAARDHRRKRSPEGNAADTTTSTRH